MSLEVEISIPHVRHPHFSLSTLFVRDISTYECHPIAAISYDALVSPRNRP
jgi:hypothetical protein